VAVGEDDVPASIGFVFDTSASMGVKLDLSRKAVAEFLKSANPDDEFFLLPFDSHPGSITGFTTRAEDIIEQLAHARPAGTTAMLDAIQAAFLNMRRAKNTRRAIIIISDGGDNHSRTTKTDILRMAREADAQVYTLGTYEPPAVRHRTPEEFTGPELLAGISEQTGGRSFPVRKSSDIADAAIRIGFELRNQYVIAYRPANRNWNGLYRRITV
jgi:Ca-activated chloride channel family protein